MSNCLRSFLLYLENVDESSSKLSFCLSKMYPEYVNDEVIVASPEYVNDEVVVATPEYVNDEVVVATKDEIQKSTTSSPVSNLDVKEYRRPGHKRSEEGVYDSIRLSTIHVDSDPRSRRIKDVNGIHRKEGIEQTSKNHCWGTSKKKKIVISILCIVLICAVISGSTIFLLLDEEIFKTKDDTKDIENSDSSISISPTMPSNNTTTLPGKTNVFTL